MSGKNGAGKGKRGAANDPDKNNAGRMAAGSPVAKGDRGHEPVEDSPQALDGPSATNTVADKQKDNEYSTDSSDGKQLLISHFQLPSSPINRSVIPSPIHFLPSIVVPYHHQSLCCGFLIIVSFPKHSHVLVHSSPALFAPLLGANKKRALSTCLTFHWTCLLSLECSSFFWLFFWLFFSPWTNLLSLTLPYFLDLAPLLGVVFFQLGCSHCSFKFSPFSFTMSTPILRFDSSNVKGAY
jgi:hypothetical protein